MDWPFFKSEEDFFEFLASAASIVSCFGRTEGHALDLCVKVVSLEFFTHTYGEAKEKKKSRVSEIDVLVQKQLYNEWNLPVIEFSNLKS